MVTYYLLIGTYYVQETGKKSQNSCEFAHAAKVHPSAHLCHGNSDVPIINYNYIYTDNKKKKVLIYMFYLKLYTLNLKTY